MSSAAPEILTVSQLTAQIKETLESTYPLIWVGGEVSDYSQSHAGHIYFTLKDERAQIRAVIWRTTAARLRFQLQDGLALLCCGSVDVYPPRGSYQLVIRQVEPQGEGAQQLALRQLHAKLAAEGLFDPLRKRPLPRFPRRIVIITSPTGAAIRDFLEVLRRRWAGSDVLLIPARVQGAGAAQEIAQGIRLANRLLPRADVLVVARGGGSVEDLWSFNEETVVRAIAASAIPVVSAVGHDIDVTLSDLVADVREPTPSAAAERVVPSSEEVLGGLRNLAQRMSRALGRRADQLRNRLDAIARHRLFRRPLDRVHEYARQLDEFEARQARAVRLACQREQERVAALTERLESLSPLAVLRRGYTVTTRASDGTLIRSAEDLTVGDRLTTQFPQGRAISSVEKLETRWTPGNATPFPPNGSSKDESP